KKHVGLFDRHDQVLHEDFAVPVASRGLVKRIAFGFLVLVLNLLFTHLHIFQVKKPLQEKVEPAKDQERRPDFDHHLKDEINSEVRRNRDRLPGKFNDIRAVAPDYGNDDRCGNGHLYEGLDQLDIGPGGKELLLEAFSGIQFVELGFDRLEGKNRSDLNIVKHNGD